MKVTCVLQGPSQGRAALVDLLLTVVHTHRFAQAALSSGGSVVVGVLGAWGLVRVNGSLAASARARASSVVSGVGSYLLLRSYCCWVVSTVGPGVVVIRSGCRGGTYSVGFWLLLFIPALTPAKC